VSDLELPDWFLAEFRKMCNTVSRLEGLMESCKDRIDRTEDCLNDLSNKFTNQVRENGTKWAGFAQAFGENRGKLAIMSILVSATTASLVSLAAGLIMWACTK